MAWLWRRFLGWPTAFELVPSEFLEEKFGNREVSLENCSYFETGAVVELCEDITKEELRSCGIFRAWFTTLALNLQLQDKVEHTFHMKPFKLRKITIQSVNWKDATKPGSKSPPRRHILFLMIKSVITNGPGKTEIPGIAFLRGGSVSMLVIVKPKDSRQERYVILTEQARVPAGSLRFKEIPAGMLDAENNIVSKAISEINEETGLKFEPEELINLTELSIQEAHHHDAADMLQRAMYPSPGGSDEFISIFLCIKELDRAEISFLQNKLTGQRRRGELIKLSLCNYEDLWKEGARDAKTLAAWTLYEGLSRSGVLQRELDNRKETDIARLQARRVHPQDDSDDD